MDFSFFVSVCAGMCQYVDFSKYVLVCAGMCRYVVVCVGMCRYVQVCAGMWSLVVAFKTIIIEENMNSFNYVVYQIQ